MSSLNKYSSAPRPANKFLSKSPDFSANYNKKLPPNNGSHSPFAKISNKSPFNSELPHKKSPFSNLRNSQTTDGYPNPYENPNTFANYQKPFEKISQPTSFPKLNNLKPSPINQYNKKLDGQFDTPIRGGDGRIIGNERKNSDYCDDSFAQTMEKNRKSYLDKLKKSEDVQNSRQMQYEKNVLFAGNSKEQSLDQLIQKRMMDKSKVLEVEENFKANRRSPGRKHYIPDDKVNLTWDDKDLDAGKSKNLKDEVLEKMRIIEEMRKNERKDRVIVESVKGNDKEFNRNMEKFFGTDEGDIEKELPGSSTLINAPDKAQSPISYGKTVLKTSTYDPITDSTTRYDSTRTTIRPLGSKKLEPFPGKISDAEGPRPSDYNRNFKNYYDIVNPLTGEVKQINMVQANGNDSLSKYQYVIKNHSEKDIESNFGRNRNIFN